jgi:predicted neutral ceramidase superfamily lipid hydrolase
MIDNRLKLIFIILLTFAGVICFILSHFLYTVEWLFLALSCLSYLSALSAGLSFLFSRQSKTNLQKGCFAGTMFFLLLSFVLSCFIYSFVYKMDKIRGEKEAQMKMEGEMD